MVPKWTPECQCLVRILQGTGEAGKVGNTVEISKVVKFDEYDKPAEEVAALASYELDNVVGYAAAAGTEIVAAAMPHNSFDPV